MERIVDVTTIDEEFEKSRVKTHLRTKKGKLERVKEFERKSSSHVLKKEEGGPDIRSKDLKAISASLERRGVKARVKFRPSHLVGHRAITIEAATESAERKAKRELKDFGIKF